MITAKNKNDAKAFEKLGVKSLLDLALLLPKSFENTFITPQPLPNSQGVVKITCKGVLKHPKHISVKAYCQTWDFDIKLIIFNPRPFHLAMFKEGTEQIVSGKVEYAFGSWQIVQPKVLKETGTIELKYKVSLQNKTMTRLMREYLHVKVLNTESIRDEEAKLLVKLHEPSLEAMRLFDEVRFSEKVLPTLKRAEILNYLNKLSRKRVEFKSTCKLLGDEREFIDSLPFELTNDQKAAINDIKEDLAKEVATKRVVMGDVGSGKTMVILASVMMSYPKKAVLMAPTTLLANQIFEEAKKFLPLHVKSSLVTSSSKNENLEEADFIVGTHALLYQELPKCDLVMIDEQHRFGTKQRELIHKLVSVGDAHPHFIQFTATPIPRTLSMIHSSLVKYSFIKETPFKKDIDTFVISKNGFKNLLTHIEEEIKENRQVAIIYPLVEESESLEYQSLDEGRGFWEKRYKNVFVTHGKDKDKEEVLENFRENGDILLATTVMEVGISLPRLSTIVIVGAERLGLASLHQLRGRVSRTGLKGYCYLFTHKEVSERLNEFSKTKSGFDIAELDLKYRQSGDLLSGQLQHGVAFKWFSMVEDEKILEEIKMRLGV